MDAVTIRIEFTDPTDLVTVSPSVEITSADAAKPDLAAAMAKRLIAALPGISVTGYSMRTADVDAKPKADVTAQIDATLKTTLEQKGGVPKPIPAAPKDQPPDVKP